MSSRHQTWSGWIDAKSSVATPPFASSQRSLAAILLVAGPPGAIALVNRADGEMRRPIDELGLGARRPRGIASERSPVPRQGTRQRAGDSRSPSSHVPPAQSLRDCRRGVLFPGSLETGVNRVTVRNLAPNIFAT